MIPASGEFTYATAGIRKGGGGAQVAENLNALPDVADMVVALDRLQASAPQVESVSLVVAWFGNDLRAGSCALRPGVEVPVKTTSPQTWSVNGVGRADAHLVSRDANDRPVYGGTPADFAVAQAIREMKARGLRVTFYPFILMDVPPGNTLPNPYSDNAAETGQPVFPWRGRITCSPAAGYAGTVDKTDAAATQVAALFGSATPESFAVSGESVSWTGPADDRGLRRMVLHYAHLCAAAGGVDAFLIGTEMRGLTTIRSGTASYPAVQAFRDLAADVRAILGPGAAISYAADWSAYFGHQPGDGSGDVFFHLDPLWADANTDFIGIDNYMPLSDWRDGFEHADARDGWPAIHDRAYLQANIAGGEGFDWFYASAADRAAQVRTPITDGGEAGSATGLSDPPNGKPWVFRTKDLRAWWSNPHHHRPGGVEAATPTAWAPQSKPIRFSMAVPPEEAERRCRRALMEAWVGRETASFRLPPSRLALDPADVVTLQHDGRAVPLRLVSIADAEARGVEAVRQDREACDLPPGAPRPASVSKAVVFGAPEAVILDLPQLTEDRPAHRPLIAAHAAPWPGEIAVFRSPSTDGFDLLATVGSRARIGTLVSDLYAGPTSRFDLGNVAVVDLLSGQLAVLDRDRTAPPASPDDGDRHIVASGATGLWAGWDFSVACWVDGAWMRLPPRAGWRAWVEAEGALLVFDGAAWVSTTPTALQQLTRLGLGTAADAANPVAAKLDAALWTALTAAEGGTGDLFYTMNKETAADDLGLTLQSGFVTRALLGLFGSDRFRLAVSADGAAFFDALIADNVTGIVDQPRLPRFKAWTTYDNYVGVGTWTKIAINNTDVNDQGAFDAANNRFVAPVAGDYLFAFQPETGSNGSSQTASSPRPPRAASSHSASVGRRPPTHRA